MNDNPELPYGLTEDELVLDRSSVGRVDIYDVEQNISTLVELSPEASIRVLRAVAALQHATDASWRECMDTALIWECG